MDTIRVVIADDHAVVRDGIAHTLKKLPNLEIVGEVGDGIALFALLARTHPDCLLLDVAMPDFEPISAVRQIRANYPDLKILVVSAYDDDTYVQGLLAAGAHGYQLKDQPLSDLVLAVQRILAGERWVCSPLVAKLLQPSNGAATPLTNRQRELVRCLQEGLDNQSIAHKVGLSVKTIENELTRLYRHLQVQSRLEAVNFISLHPELVAVAESATHHNGDGSSAAAIPGLTILIVDDNLHYRNHLTHLISRAVPQAQVYQADNIQTAFDLTKEHAPQLALIDVVLGDENGIECTRRIREQSAATRIILISAYPDRAYHQLGLEAGAVAFLDKKDLNAAALREIIYDTVQVVDE